MLMIISICTQYTAFSTTSQGWDILITCWHSSMSIRSNFVLDYIIHHLSVLLSSNGHCTSWQALHNSCCHFLDGISAPLFHSALLHHLLYSPWPPNTPHLTLFFSWWQFSFSPAYILTTFKLHFNSQLGNISIQPWLNITNWAKQHSSSISPTQPAWIVCKYNDYYQVPCAVNRVCVSALISPG